MEKKIENEREYVEPKAEVIAFEAEDVIVTSDPLGGGGIVLPDDNW